jgi:hypothetical protein
MQFPLRKRYYKKYLIAINYVITVKIKGEMRMYKKMFELGLKFNGTHQLLTYADDVNLLGGNIVTINKIKENVIDTTKEDGPEVCVEKTKYMFVS